MTHDFSSIVIKKSRLPALVGSHLAADQLLEVYFLLALDGNGVGLIGQELLAGVHGYPCAHEVVGLHGLAGLFVLVLVFDLVHPLFGQRLAEVVVLARQVDQLVFGREDQARGIHLLLRARKTNAAFETPTVAHFFDIQKLVERLLHA